jgi:gliding motility-associated-like protein
MKYLDRDVRLLRWMLGVLFFVFWGGSRVWGQISLTLIPAGGQRCIGDTVYANIELPASYNFDRFDYLTIDGQVILTTPNSVPENRIIVIDQSFPCGNGFSGAGMNITAVFDYTDNMSNSFFNVAKAKTISIRCPPVVAYPLLPYCTLPGSNLLPSQYFFQSIANLTANLTITGSGLSINSANGMISGANISGNQTVSWFETGTNSCPNYSGSINVNFVAPGVSSIIYPSPKYCIPRTTPISIQSSNPSGGSFTISPNSNISISNTGTITTTNLTQPNLYQISYTPPGCYLPTTTFVELVNDSVSIACPTAVFCPGSGPTSSPLINLMPSISFGGKYSTIPALVPPALDTNNGTINTNFAPPGSYQLFYTTRNNQCNKTYQATGTIVIASSPSPIFEYSPRHICKDPGVVLPILTPPNVPTYSAPGITINATSGGITPITSLGMGGPIIVTHTIGGVCPVTDTFHVYLHDREKAGFYYGSNASATIDTVCPGDFPLLLNFKTGTTQNGTFLSLPGNGSVSFNPSGDIVGYSNPGLHQVAYQTTGQCPDRDTFSIFVKPTPSFNIQYPVHHLCRGSSTPIFQTSGSLPLGTFSCPGLNISGNTGAIYPQSSTGPEGPYIVSFATIAPECPASDTAQMWLVNPDLAQFFYGDTPTNDSAEFCSNIGVCDARYLPGTETNGVFRIFPAISQPGSGTPAVSPFGLVTFHNALGRFLVEYTTPSQLPCGSAKDTFLIIIKPAPSADIDYVEHIMCPGDLEVPILVQQSALDSFWVAPLGLLLDPDFGTIDIVSSDSLPPGQKYEITHTVSLQNGQCPDTAKVEVRIRKPYSLVTLFTDTSAYCTGDSFIMIVLNNHTPKGRWDVQPGGLAYRATLDSLIAYPSSQNIAIDYTITYLDYGYCNEDTSKLITNIPKAPTSLDYPQGELGSVTYCTNDIHNPLAPIFPDSGSFSYLSNGQDILGLNPSTGEIDLNQSEAGTYEVHYRPSTYCHEDGIDTIVVLQAPSHSSLVLQFEANTDSLCEGDNLAFSAATTPWHEIYIEGDSVGSTLSNYLLDTVYDQEHLTIRFIDNNQCYLDSSITLSVHPHPNPIILPEATTAYVTSDDIKLEMISQNPQTIFHWSVTLSDTNITLLSDSTATTPPLDDGQFENQTPDLKKKPSATITKIQYVIRSEAFGCVGEKDTVLFLLIPNDDPGIFIPGAISPNGDDKNDTWKVTWDNLNVKPEDYQIQLFNRSGGLVYTMTPLVSTWNGENLPDGVYLYILRKIDGKYERRGGLTIRREAKQRGE